jgi:uncharacterized protein YjbJ (UPF0337 family)
MEMNVIKGRWKKLRGRVQEEWGRLTDRDLVRVRGRRDRLVGRIQELYGIARGKVERQLARLERLLEEERTEIAEENVRASRAGRPRRAPSGRGAKSRA